MKLPAFRQRLQIDASKLSEIREVLNGGSPEVPNGSALQFECGAFYGDRLVDQLDNLASILLEVKDLSDLGGAPLLSGVVEVPDFNTALTAAAWSGNQEADCHFKFQFTSVETNLDLGNATRKTFRLVISAQRLDGDAFPLGYTDIDFIEDGSSITPSASIVYFFRPNGGYPEFGYPDLTFHALRGIIMSDGTKAFEVVQAASGANADFNSDHFRQSEGYLELLFPDGNWYRIKPVIMVNGRYSIEVSQDASGEYAPNSANWRVVLGYAQMKFPDGTWHRLISAKVQDVYSIDVHQTASPE